MCIFHAGTNQNVIKHWLKAQTTLFSGAQECKSISDKSKQKNVEYLATCLVYMSISGVINSRVNRKV